jgi:hypothetical protein
MSQNIDYKICQTCGERGVPVHIEGGTVYSYPCTAEIVVFDYPGKKPRVIKACPDIGRAERGKTILTRSEE